MDELARSNGTTVKGYKIFIDNKDKQLIPSPHMTKALIERLNLQRTHSFSIQTLAENGATSRMVDTLFDDVLVPDVATAGASGQDRDWTVTDGEMSSVMSSTHPDDGERRVFLAVYDYAPAEHSPQNHPGQQLAFKTGDVIVTYGAKLNDGFYYGKVHGKKGFLPSSFMEEIALLRPRGRTSASTISAASYQSLSSRYSGSRPHSSGSRPYSSGSRPSSSGSHPYSAGSRPQSSQSTLSYQSDMGKSSASTNLATATV